MDQTAQAQDRFADLDPSANPSSLPPSGPAPSPGGQSPPVGDLLAGAATDLGGVVKGELQLGKAELKEQAVAAGGGVAALGASGVAGLFGAGFLLLAVERLLAKAMPSWASSGLVALALLGGAGALGASGKAKLAAANPRGTQTAASLRETASWAKGRLNTLGR